MDLKELLHREGADVVGIASADRFEKALPGCKPTDLLPGARALAAFAVRIPRGALESANYRLITNAWNMANAELTRLGSKAVRFLEDLGYLAVAIPPFLPVDMLEKHGLAGDLSLKHAAAMAGLGQVGESGLLLTSRFGPRQRLGAVITDAPLEPDPSGAKNWCKACADKPCVRACPAGAIEKGTGKLDKLLCLDRYQRFGGRALARFLRKLLTASTPETSTALLKFPSVLEFYEMHQFIRVGGVACAECMRACPVGA